eukprot:6080635-Heterocapsa_arctica.AAC.1
MSLRKGVNRRSISCPTLSRGLDDIDFVSNRKPKRLNISDNFDRVIDSFGFVETGLCMRSEGDS